MNIQSFQNTLISLSGLLFFLSFSLLIPELPGLIDHFSDGYFTGLVFTIFSLASALSRPFAGKFIDAFGKINMIICGLIFCLVAGVFYPFFANSLFVLLGIRFIHGISKGFAPTAMTAFITDHADSNGRSKALGSYSIATSIGISIGPAIGGLIATTYGIDVLFYSSFVTALGSMGITIYVSRHTTNIVGRPVINWRFFMLSKKDIILKKALPPSILHFCFSIGFGVVLTLVPQISQSVGIDNKGSFFFLYALCSIGIRFFTSSLSDRYGRKPILKVTSICYGLCLLSFVFIDSKGFFYIVSASFGIARGIMIPALFAWIADVSERKERGRAISTFFIFMEVGTGLGALLSEFSLLSLYLPFVIATLSMLICFRVFDTRAE